VYSTKVTLVSYARKSSYSPTSVALEVLQHAPKIKSFFFVLTMGFSFQ